MQLKLAAYLPKRIVSTPDWLQVPAVVAIRSVSACISPTADENDRLRNALDVYDSPELARSAAIDRDWRLFAYKVSPVRYLEQGREEPWPWPDVTPTPLPTDLRSIGFDAVNDSTEIGFHVSCSPLSCNRAAERWPVNAHRLLDRFDVAITAGRRFASDVEPGPYFVAEVLCAG